MTQPWGTALLIFEALGLGLALPFLLLSLVPAWQRLLPRPGPWMERLQQLLAFPLYASVAWLVWVLSQQAGPPGRRRSVLAGLVLLGFAAWLRAAGRGAAPPGAAGPPREPRSPPGSRWRRSPSSGPSARGSSPTEAPAGAAWEPFSPGAWRSFAPRAPRCS